MGIFSRKKKEDKLVEAPVAAKTVVKDVQKDKKPTSAKKAIKKSDSKVINAYRILIRPIISEKATIGASGNQYTFEIATGANKIEVKQAVEEVYGVKPISVNIINSRGRQVRFGRTSGSTRRSKKAIVTVAKGQSIKLYEGI